MCCLLQKSWLPDSEMNAEVCYDFHGLLQHSSLQYMCSCCHTKCVIGIDSMCSQLYTRLRLASPFRYKTWARVPVDSCLFSESMRGRAVCSSRFGFTCAAWLRVSCLTALASIAYLYIHICIHMNCRILSMLMQLLKALMW